MSINIRPYKDGRRHLVDVWVKRPSDGVLVRDRKVVGGSRLQARNWALERERALLDNKGSKPKVECPTFDQFATDWLATYRAKGLRPTTVGAVVKNLKVHLRPFFGNTRLDAIDRKVLDKFVAHMFEKISGNNVPKSERTSRNGYLTEPKHLSAKTVKHTLSTLHGMMVTAEEWGTLDKVPKFPKVKIDETRWDFYNVAESALLLASARDDDERLWILFALHTGARAGELLALERGDLDFHSSRVDFRRSTTNGITSPTPKSRKGRSVPLSEPLAAGLKAARHLKGDLVFSQADGSPLTLWHLHGALIRASRKAGLRLLRWHDLRHSFASNLVAGGTPLRQVQEWLGHSTIVMTMRYAHLAPGGGREFLSALTAPPLPEAAAR